MEGYPLGGDVFYSFVVSFDNFVFLQNGGIREIPVGRIGKDFFECQEKRNIAKLRNPFFFSSSCCLDERR